jgi:hypothetical protein
MLVRSARGVSAGSGSVDFSTGTDSPVRADSSTWRLRDFTRRKSAGTLSPDDSSTISPGTEILGLHPQHLPAPLRTVVFGGDGLWPGRQWHPQPWLPAHKPMMALSTVNAPDHRRIGPGIPETLSPPPPAAGCRASGWWKLQQKPQPGRLSRFNGQLIAAIGFVAAGNFLGG